MLDDMKKIFLPILLGLAMLAVSCEHNLDIAQKGVITPEDFYASDADAEALLANMYVSCFGNHGIAGTEGIYNNQLMIYNYSADDVLAAGGDAQDHLDFRVFDEFRYDNANSPLYNLYIGYCNSIYTANLIISNFTNENAEGTEPKFASEYTKRCVAEARVFRAYLHMMMAFAWYQPCIIDRLSVNLEDLPVQAESQKQVLDWVISECKAAIDSGYLPERAGTSDKDATAIMTKGFAQFIIGKAAMFNDDTATARSYLRQLIDSGDYALVPTKDYWTLFHAAGDGNSEVIFAPNFLRDDNFTANAWGSGMPIQRGRWMIADVLCWRTDALASTPTVCSNLPGSGGGWNGGAITEAFAEKFAAHDGKSPRRLATFLTEDEFLYEMDWSGSQVNDGTLEQKKLDESRGIKSTNGVYSHGRYFEWKNMVWHNIPRIVLQPGDDPSNYMSDDLSSLGANSNVHNLTMARYAEALLLYAEACIGNDGDGKGLAALNMVQERSGSGKVSNELTIQNVMEEKQYEMWFEGARFHDLVRWSVKYPSLVNLDAVFNGSQIHDNIPIVTDEFFTDGSAYKDKEHKLSVRYVKADFKPFEVGKHEYLPFPRDSKIVNTNLKDVKGWAYLNE